MATYKSKKSDEEKEKFVKQHINNVYVPYEHKANVAKAITDSCFWKKHTNSDGTIVTEMEIDSIAKHMLTCMAIVDLYTDIERQKSDGKMLEDFNTLNGSGVLDYIIQNIEERELKEFNMILQMTCDDIITNEYENHAFVRKQVDRFGELIGTILAPVISQLDTEKIESLISGLQNM